MTMPQYQRQGFGRFLIEFSYLLSREEGQLGTPEKPLSDLGRLSYHAYWKSVVLEYLYEHRNKEEITFKHIANKTGLFLPDIALAFQLLNFIKLGRKKGDIRYKIFIKINWDKVVQHCEKVRKTATRIPIEPDCLRWTPLSSNVSTLTTTNKLSASSSDNEDEPHVNKKKKSKFSLLNEPVSNPNVEKTTTAKQRKLLVKREIPSRAIVSYRKGSSEIDITSTGRRRARPLRYFSTTFATDTRNTSRVKNDKTPVFDRSMNENSQKKTNLKRKSSKTVNDLTSLANIKSKKSRLSLRPTIGSEKTTNFVSTLLQRRKERLTNPRKIKWRTKINKTDDSKGRRSLRWSNRNQRSRSSFECKILKSGAFQSNVKAKIPVKRVADIKQETVEIRNRKKRLLKSDKKINSSPACFNEEHREAISTQCQDKTTNVTDVSEKIRITNKSTLDSNIKPSTKIIKDNTGIDCNEELIKDEKKMINVAPKLRGKRNVNQQCVDLPMYSDSCTTDESKSEEFKVIVEDALNKPEQLFAESTAIKSIHEKNTLTEALHIAEKDDKVLEAVAKKTKKNLQNEAFHASSSKIVSANTSGNPTKEDCTSNKKIGFPIATPENVDPPKEKEQISLNENLKVIPTENLKNQRNTLESPGIAIDNKTETEQFKGSISHNQHSQSKEQVSFFENDKIMLLASSNMKKEVESITNEKTPIYLDPSSTVNKRNLKKDVYSAVQKLVIIKNKSNINKQIQKDDIQTNELSPKMSVLAPQQKENCSNDHEQHKVEQINQKLKQQHNTQSQHQPEQQQHQTEQKPHHPEKKPEQQPHHPEKQLEQHQHHLEQQPQQPQQQQQQPKQPQQQTQQPQQQTQQPQQQTQQPQQQTQQPQQQTQQPQQQTQQPKQQTQQPQQPTQQPQQQTQQSQQPQQQTQQPQQQPQQQTQQLQQQIQKPQQQTHQLQLQIQKPQQQTQQPLQQQPQQQTQQSLQQTQQIQQQVQQPQQQHKQQPQQQLQTPQSRAQQPQTQLTTQKHQKGQKQLEQTLPQQHQTELYHGSHLALQPQESLPSNSVFKTSQNRESLASHRKPEAYVSQIDLSSSKVTNDNKKAIDCEETRSTTELNVQSVENKTKIKQAQADNYVSNNTDSPDIERKSSFDRIRSDARRQTDLIKTEKIQQTSLSSSNISTTSFNTIASTPTSKNSFIGIKNHSITATKAVASQKPETNSYGGMHIPFTTTTPSLSLSSMASSSSQHEKFQSTSKGVEQKQGHTTVDINKIAPQFSINQMPNYHASPHPQYWQWDYYPGYNLSHIEASAVQKTQNKYKDLATSLTYGHTFQQNLYQNTLAMQQQQQNHQIQQAIAVQKEKHRMDRKNTSLNTEKPPSASSSHGSSSKKDDKLVSKETSTPSSCSLIKQQQNYDHNHAYNQQHTKISNGSLSNTKTNNIKPVDNSQKQTSNIPQHTGVNNPQHNQSTNTITHNTINLMSQQQQLISHKTGNDQDLTPNSTPNLENVKQASSSTEIPSMVVYTPDSTNNSVHGLQHHYEQCEIDVAQLSLESPNSIASDITSQNSVENVRSPSVQIQHQQQFSDCSMQQTQTNSSSLHMTMHQTNQQNIIATSPPQGISLMGITASMSNHQQPQQNHNRKISQQVRNTNTAAQRASTPKISRSNSNTNIHQRQPSRSTPPRINPVSSSNNVVQQQLSSPNQSAQQIIQQQQNHQNAQQMQQYGHLVPHVVHHHQGIHQSSEYLTIPQMSQNFSGNSSYNNVSMPSVIQHRMAGSHTLPSPHQRLGPSPSSCAISSSSVNSFYVGSNSTSQPPGTITTPAAPSMHINTSTTTAGAGVQTTQGQGNSSGGASASGGTPLLVVQTSNTSPVGQVNLTPPPNNHHPHSTMTPPPIPSHLATQNRNITTPPTSLQPQIPTLQYHKYYPTNINGASAVTSLTDNRPIRNPSSTPVQHISSTDRASTVPLNPNLMSPYGALNGYRMTAAQQTTGYITNNTTGTGLFNSPGTQLPVQMGVMNMQPQYQEASAIQRAAQQSSMYPTYSPYIPLNSTMRR